MFKKNTAVTGFPFGLVTVAAGTAVTSGTVTGYYTLDGGTQGTIAGAATHEGNGQWSVNLLAAEMNGDIVGLLLTHALAINVPFTIKTDTKITSELNDIAATDIVSAGAIDTTAGAVDNVTLVATTTTNTDQRGTDNAATATALATAQADLDIITGAAGALLDTTATSPQLVDDVWDEVISKATHNIGQSAAKILRQGGDLVQIDGVVSDVSPLTTDFDTNLTQQDDYFEDSVLIFSNGSANAGIGKPVSAYVNANGNMSFLAPDDWPVTPVNGDDFVIYATHVHPILQIQTGLATEAKQDIIDGNVDLILEDTADMQPKLGTPADDLAADLAAVKVVDDAIQLVTDKFAFTVANQVDSNMLAIDDDATAATYLKAHARRAIPVTFSGGSTTTGIIATIDGGSPHTSDTQYVNRILLFSAPAALRDQVLGVTGYIGSTGTLTVTASTAAIGADAVAVLV